MILASIDTKGYNNKPQNNEIGKISTRIANNVYQISDLKGFADFISAKGHTWCPAVFSGTRKISDFKSIQFIALDFDEGAVFEDIYKRSVKYMLPILFAYETFSSVDTNKFRVIFLLEEAITDIDVFNRTIAMFMKIFPECDKSCKDVSRMFFGGKQLIYYDESEYTVGLEQLDMNFSLYLKDRYGSTHYKAHLKKFNSVYQKNKNGKISPYIINNKTINGENLPKNHKAYRQDILERLYSKCRLYREFIDDSEWLYYKSLYGIAVNMTHIETGEKIFINTIKNSKYDTYNRDWKFYIKYFKDHEYMPIRCENFCPYCDKCCHGNNMLDTAKIKRKEILRLKEPEYSDIKDVQAELKSCFYEAMKSRDKKIHVIKAQTAIGKTHIYIEYLKTSEAPSIIAVPTNKLKNEIYDECIKAGISVMETPSIYEIKDNIPPDIYDKIEYLYRTGKHNKVMQYIRSKANESPALKAYVEYSEEVNRFEGHIITTHQKVLYASDRWLKKYNIIIDEDILKTMVKNQISVEISDIEDLLSHNISEKVRNHLNKIIDNADKHLLFSVDPIGSCKAKVDFNLNALLNAENFYTDGKTLVFYNTPELKDMKYTVLSATADEYIYENYFGSDRIVFHMCKTAKYKGKLIQYFDNSYSRRYIERNEKTYDEIEKIVGDVPKITFKKYSNDEYGIHFGNSEGCNCMKGQDIAVIGTPHMADFIYRLLAYQMGYNSEDDKLRYQEVCHNGYKFWFYTYQNELMRRIQFWMIESELEQSVGRARLLREDCTVWLFSDFPLAQSDLRQKRNL